MSDEEIKRADEGSADDAGYEADDEGDEIKISHHEGDEDEVEEK